MNAFLRPKNCFFSFLLTLILSLSCFSFTACKRSVDYFSYVSELRDNIFLAETDSFSLRIYSVKKESPYAADGVPREVSARTEIYFVAPEGVENCRIHFTVDNQTHGGDTSYDNVRSEYYLFLPLDISQQKKLACVIEYGGEKYAVDALSVLDGEELTPQEILQAVELNNAELFASMTDKYGFTGEIYMRLIFEDAPYYYVGVVNRSEGVYAHLVNAKTGKVLAKRQS